MSVGLLLLRLLLAALLFGHSTQKLLGWFGGAGPAGTAVVFEQWGFVPGRRLVLLAGAAELLGAVSIAAGLVTPAGCAVVVGTMTVAAAATAPNGFWAQQGGCEVPFCYGALAAILGFSGPGMWSLDAALGLSSLSGYARGMAALGVGLLAAVVPLTARARELRARRNNHSEVAK
ncbi:putative oxidoreductase [Halopolyspora algeriensis]|uniref:Putative oxidoreductase n=2 Tax=Halopolyspora algeriensis TaxID=1500506 RepID=A0A368VJ45_9ACTN|nr:putative oxidoreductase [Halopolyspora algeriensis]TQM54023.1 putative oxidoreductase [Halopolyspora algeriensis]